MLEIILIALYALIVGQIQKPFAKRIQESENIERAIRVRKKYKMAEDTLNEWFGPEVVSGLVIDLGEE